MKMDKKSIRKTFELIEFHKDRIEKSGMCNGTNKNGRFPIEELRKLTISPNILIETKLVNYMKGLGYRFPSLKKEADKLAEKWQQQVDLWLQENNLTEKHYLEQLERQRNTIHPVSPRLNGTRKANQRNSGSDDRLNYHSSSSQEVESPDSQRAYKRYENIDRRFNLSHSFVRKSSSPLQLENPVTRNFDSAEFNANLSIDPKEVTPISCNKIKESPVKPNDRFYIPLKEKMFQAVKLKEQKENHAAILFICQDVLNLPSEKYPDFIREHRDKKNKKSIHMPNNSHNMPSTSQQRTGEYSKSCPESKHDRRKKHMDNIQSDVKAKELKEELQPSGGNKSLPSISQQSGVESSRSGPGSKHDRKKRHMESTQSVVNSKELKMEQQPTHDCKNLPSMSQQGVTESSRNGSVSKHDRKRKHMDSSQSASRNKELKEEQQSSLDSKLKHKLRTEYVAKGRESKEELQLVQGRALKCKETAQFAAKAYEFKDECQPAQDGKLKLDSKRVGAMALETRNCDKSHIKKRDSPDTSAMLAITSSKKERTSLYHGGRKSEIPKLNDLSVRALLKGMKQTSDPRKYIKINVEFKILEPVLVLLSPEKLYKLEEEMEYLKADTDNVWQFCCSRNFKSMLHLKRESENWRTFYQRCCVESEERLRNVAANISTSASKAKPDRQIKLTTVDHPPAKRFKTDHTVLTKNSANNSATKPLQNSCHPSTSRFDASVNSCHPSTSRSDASVPPKGLTNHIKSSHKTIKKDAPLMHKAKKTLGQLHRIHRS